MSSFIFFSLAISSGLSSSPARGAWVEFDVELPRVAPLEVNNFELVLEDTPIVVECAGSGRGEEASGCTDCVGGGDNRTIGRDAALDAGIRMAKDPALGIILIPLAGTRGAGGFEERELFEV